MNPSARPEVNRAKLDELLSIGAESATLDYKRTVDLDNTRDIVELAKDVGAMMRRGGHLVIGADDAGGVVAGGGIAAGQVRTFDEANLRGKLKRYLGTDFDLHTATHNVIGVTVGVIHIPAHPAGYLPFTADGNYPSPRRPGQQVTVFREGDIYVRQGTASVKANQTEITSIIEQAAARKNSVAPAVPPDWRMSDQEFETAVGAAIEEGRDITLRRFLENVRRDVGAVNVNDRESIRLLIPGLDRLACLAALAVRWGRTEWVDPVVQVLLSIYRTALTDVGTPQSNDAVRLMMLIINRVYGIGAVAVAAHQWAVIPTLVVQQPAANVLASGHYTNWFRHTHTHASRANALSYRDSNGQTVSTSYLEITLLDIKEVPCLNDEAPAIDPLRNRLAQFDALATVTVYGLAPGDGDHPYYPWHRAYEAPRYEPALVTLLEDATLRDTIYPHDDHSLAILLEKLRAFSVGEFAKYGGGWPYMAEPIRVFLATQGQ